VCISETDAWVAERLVWENSNCRSRSYSSCVSTTVEDAGI